MKDKIKIISDGADYNTKVFCGDKEIKGITKIEINIVTGNMNTAIIYIADVGLEISVDNSKAIRKLQQAAKYKP